MSRIINIPTAYNIIDHMMILYDILYDILYTVLYMILLYYILLYLFYMMIVVCTGREP